MNLTKEENYMTDYIIDELKKYGYTDVQGKTRRELKYELGKLRAKEVQINNPGSDWF